ncbi:MAG TPA: formate/nitrite transporter family protein [Anaeromyxobacteraceae bacterium]|nr:formate/nitrite transporter family protein [Anaeromyxobacteraceae bacterium]
MAERSTRDHLDEAQQREAEERSAVAVHVVHEAVRMEGEEELRRPASALAWSALAAGLSMGFSLVAEALLRAGLPDAPWRPLVAKLGYSVGFLVVILARQQLFTEQTLTVILPALDQRSLARTGRVARVWAIVLAGNVLGALLFAWLIGRGDVFPPELKTAFEELGREAMEPEFWTKVWRGIFGGWLIALMVWLLPGAANARVFVIVVITYLVGLGRFTHVVAGSAEALYLVTHGDLSPLDYLGGFLLPAFLGNAIGGVSLVAALNHAQVAAGLGRRAET